METDNLAISNFCEYLRIKTVQPNPDYAGCIKFLKKIGLELGLVCREIEMVPGKPIMLMTLQGTNPALPAILLNSHTDVVPVSEINWSHDPFGATLLPNGDIVARGSQDMKCVGMAYLEAIRALKSRKDWRPFPRTIHLSFVPDEEIGGATGMKLLVESTDFKELNIGVAFDEGLPSPTEEIVIFYGERSPYWISIVAKGAAGHGSTLIKNTAVEKLLEVMQRVIVFRDEQMAELARQRGNLGSVTSVNITMLSGGTQINVIPDAVEARIDLRATPGVSAQDVLSLLALWTKDIEGITCSISTAFESTELSPIGSPDGKSDDPAANLCWWRCIAESFKSHGVPLTTAIFPGATDSRFVRKAGIPSYGISPFRRTPILLHDHNEFLNCAVFIEGIRMYETLITALASVPQ